VQACEWEKFTGGTREKFDVNEIEIAHKIFAEH
jgi:hypothetical protein